MKSERSILLKQGRRATENGSVMLTALAVAAIVSIMIFASTAFIQNRVDQVFASASRMDNRIVLDGLLAYTINGIKQSWCFSKTWVQDLACTLNHSGNSVRLLLSDESLLYIAESTAPHPTPAVNTRLSQINQTVNLGVITPSHPLYSIVKALKGNYTQATFSIMRDDSAIATMKGREVPLRIRIKLIAASQGSKITNNLELESKIIVYPRELTYFGLILPNHLYLNSGSTSTTTGNNRLELVTTSATAGLRFESPVFINGSLHLPPRQGSPMSNVTFVDKVVLGEGMIYQDGHLFSPGTAGGPTHMFNHEMTSFRGLLAGYELDPERDRGLDYLFNLLLPTNPPIDFNICKDRVMASFDLRVTKDSQLYSRFNSRSGNTFNLSLSLGSVDNFIEQLSDVNDAKLIGTNVKGVTNAGDFTNWSGGAILKAKLVYDGLQDPTNSAIRNEFFSQFNLPREGQAILYPVGPGAAKPSIRITTSPYAKNGNIQFNQVDLSVEFINVDQLNLSAYSKGGVYRQPSVKLVIEGMDYAYNYMKNLRDNSSEHNVMGKYKMNGFTFFKSGGASMGIYHETPGSWHTNPILRTDMNYPVYNAAHAPQDIDYSAFDELCLAAPDSSESYYTSFPTADWTTSFVTQSRHAWSFNPDAPSVQGYNSGQLILDAGSSRYVAGSVYPTFIIDSLVKDCVIESSANFVAGFLTCENLIISKRTTPLRMIGTFIVRSLHIDPSAYKAGIRWSSIYHPQATYELQEAHILGKLKDDSVYDCGDPTIPPLWMPNIGITSAVKHYLCNPVSLRSADPFKWTTVDPDCGVEKGSPKVKCKRSMRRFLVKEISRTKGL